MRGRTHASFGCHLTSRLETFIPGSPEGPSATLSAFLDSSPRTAWIFQFPTRSREHLPGACSLSLHPDPDPQAFRLRTTVDDDGLARVEPVHRPLPSYTDGVVDVVWCWWKRSVAYVCGGAAARRGRTSERTRSPREAA